MPSLFFSRLKYGFALLAGAAALSACAMPGAEPGDGPEQTELQGHDVSTPSAEDGALTADAAGAAAAKASFEMSNALLAFDMPPRAELASSEYKVFAHWHNFPVRQFTTTGGKAVDNYTGWLQPTGTYAPIGGWLRDRPVPILPVPPTETDWRKRDMRLDIETAAAVGIDGFLINFWFGPTDSRWRWLTNMMDAADEFNAANPAAPFHVIPNIDSHILANKEPEENNPRERADHVATLKNHPSWMKRNGKYLVGSFRPERLSPSWYAEFFDQLRTRHGIDAVMWGTLLEPTEANRSAMKPFMAGATFSRWDILPHSSNFTSSLDTLKAWGDANGVPYSPPVGHTDHRPSGHKVVETAGFQTQYKSWKAAIDTGVKMVQILTWNDHYEGHALRPNSAMQYATYDLTAYYTTWFKTRRQPAIVRDVLYYAHRMHPSGAQPDPAKQPELFTSKNNVPFLDRVFALGMLRSSGRIQITSGGMSHGKDVAAGLQFFDAPLSVNDRPGFQLVRNGQAVLDLTSAFPTRDAIVWQDLMYRAGSSSRPVVDGVQDDLPHDRLP
ncbi:endo-1,3-alpha-glucanase family glycosylhydrolase [Sorangium sp. So ce1335]|uniref:endo-1,3-alpha-glucanase family glycosylhydrolase n=1 Tax=Sorangium sp. So ce1335 TaxID=3133335 RepID=UPI003F618A13